MSDLRHTVDFLGKFSKPDGFKYLTHRFDDDVTDFFTIVNRCRMELRLYHNVIPENLFRIFHGFLYGPEWTDAEGRVHKEHCSCDRWIDWCLNNPGIHPREEFGREFEAFRNSVRVYNGSFDEFIQDLADSCLFPGIEIDVDERSLSRFDAYVDVRTLRQMVRDILKEICDYPAVSSHPDVRVYCIRGEESADGTRMDRICIENAGSFPSQGREQAKSHLESGGGFLCSLKKKAEGNMLLSVETSWGGNPCRWNILREHGENEFEGMDPDDVTGFRYVLRIMHKS